MADFNYTQTLVYFQDSYISLDNANGSIVDDDNDNELDPTDTFNGAPYTGTTTVNAASGPVVLAVFSNGTVTYLLNPLAPQGTGNELTAAEAQALVPSSLTVDPSPFGFCFAAGTMIATPEGERAVESLQIGDLITTADGKSAAVTFLGVQTIVPVLFRDGLVRVSAGALGAGVPSRDLVLTGDHGLEIDGLMINAAALVNGDTIAFVKASELEGAIKVYHVETQAHDVILANGTPAETFIDYAGRKAFDNYADYVALYGSDRSIVELPRPRIASQRMLPPALKARLGLTAAATALKKSA
jgi:hypothetical protein